MASDGQTGRICRPRSSKGKPDRRKLLSMSAPRIAAITAFALRIPFDHWGPSPAFAGRPRTTLDTVLVRVTTDGGTVGWGEAYGGFWSAVVPAIDQWVAPLAIGQKVDDVALPARIERTLHNLGRAGATIHAISGLDIALWDIRASLPECRFRRCLAVAGAIASKFMRPCCSTMASSTGFDASSTAPSVRVLSRSNCTSARRRGRRGPRRGGPRRAVDGRYQLCVVARGCRRCRCRNGAIRTFCGSKNRSGRRKISHRLRR